MSFKFESLMIWQKAMDLVEEGSIGQSDPEFKRCMGYAIRSLAETVTSLYKADRREYITKSEFSAVFDASFNLIEYDDSI